MSIKFDAKNGQQYQKWLFALGEILSKIGIGFVSNLLLKAGVLYLTILERKKLISLPLKAETDRFVICLVLPECRTVKRIVTALMPSLLFRCFSLFLRHLGIPALEERSENCLRFRTDGPSLCIHIIVAKYSIFPRANNGRSREKKISGEEIC